MNLYPVLVFLHVVGAVGVFAAIGIEAVALPRFRRADTVAGVRTWMGLMRIHGKLASMMAVVLLVTGVWMMAWVWGMKAWLVTGFVALLVLTALGGAVTGGAMRRLGAALASESGPALSEAFRSRQRSGILVMSFNLRMALGIGVIALMTMKPTLSGSLLVMAVSLVAGWSAGLVPARGRVAGAAAGVERAETGQ